MVQTLAQNPLRCCWAQGSQFSHGKAAVGRQDLSWFPMATPQSLHNKHSPGQIYEHWSDTNNPFHLHRAFRDSPGFLGLLLIPRALKQQLALVIPFGSVGASEPSGFLQEQKLKLFDMQWVFQVSCPKPCLSTQPFVFLTANSEQGSWFVASKLN